VRVYTQNLYIGADVDKVIAAPPAQLPAALLQALATFVATDFPSRAGRIADEIGVQKPDLIGCRKSRISQCRDWASSGSPTSMWTSFQSWAPSSRRGAPV
jgi:hypothetical protein